MAKYSNTVEYNIKTTLDDTGIARLQSSLTQVQNQMNILGAKGFIPQGTVNKALADINKVKVALNQAFNPKLGMLNTSAFLSNLQKAGLTINGLYNTFSKAGAVGVSAFNSMYGQIAKIDTGMRSVSSTTDKIMNTLGNTVRWGLIASGFAAIMNSIHQAATYVKDLDKSLTNIQMVTASARDTMNDFAVEANKVAQRLGGTTVQMTNATEVFIRQGYDLATSTQLGEYAVHLANVSGQDSAMASDEITAYMNAFKIPLEDLGNAVSKWAAVANNAAVSVEELSVASQKAAAVATTVGVDMDQFAAHIAAIEATTREAPENIGNGLKTIYSRIADVKLGKTLEDGVDLGSFAKAIEKVGVQVLDSAGNLRDAGDILEDLMVVWQDLDLTQRAAVAKTVAGRFQLARFEALMNSADIYEKSLKTSQAEVGTDTYDRMQETYRDSLEGRTKALQASVEEIFLNLFTTDTFYPAVDAMQGLVDTINDLIKATGGGETALWGIVAVMTKLANNSLSRGISNFITNRQADAAARENINTAQNFARAQLVGQGLNTSNARTNMMAQDVARINQYAPIMNEAQIRQANELSQQRIQIENELSVVVERHTMLEKGLGAAFSVLNMSYQESSQGLIKLWEDFQKGEVSVELLDQEFRQFQSTLNIVAEGFNQLADSARKGEMSYKQLWENSENLVIIFKELIDSHIYEGEQLEKLIALYDILNKVSKKTAQTEEEEKIITQEMATAFENAGVEAGFLAQTLEVVAQHSKNAGSQLRENKIRLSDLATAADYASGKMKQMAYGLQIQQMTNHIIGFTQAMMSLVFVAQSFTNLQEIWSNSETDIFEKMKLSAMDFTMILAMGIPMITQMRTAYTGLRESMTLAAVQKQVNNAQTSEEIGLHAANTTAILTETRAKIQQQLIDDASAITDEGTKVRKIAIINAIYSQVGATEALNSAKIKEIALTTGGTVEEIVETAAKMGNVLATDKLTVSTMKLALAKMIANPLIAGAIVLLGGLTAALYAAAQAYYADEEAAKKASKAASELSTEWKRARDNSQKLSEGISNYRESISALNALTKGTKEWQDQLNKTNDIVLELLENYPELAQYISRTADGKLVISSTGIEEVTKARDRAEASAQAAALQGKVASLEATNKANETRLRHTIFGGYAVNPATALPDTIPAIGFEQFTNFLSEDDFRKLANAVDQQGNQILKQPDEIAKILGVQATDPIVKSIVEASDKINKQLQDNKKTQLSADIQRTQSLEAYLQSKGYDTSTENGQLAIDSLANQQAILFDKYKDEYSEWSGIELAREYLNTPQGSGLNFTGTFRDGKAEFINAQNEVVYATREMMISSLASSKSLEEVAEKWNKVADRFLGMDEGTLTQSTPEAKDVVANSRYTADEKTKNASSSSFDFSNVTTASLQRFNQNKLTGENLSTQLGLSETDLTDMNWVADKGSTLGATFANAWNQAVEEELTKRNAVNAAIQKSRDNPASTGYEDEAIESAHSILELNKVLSELKNNFGDDATGTGGLLRITGKYRKQLAELGEEYGVEAKKVQRFNKALEAYEKEGKASAEQIQELAEAQEDLEAALFEKEWIKAAHAIEEYNETLQDTDAAADDVKKASQKIADILSDLVGVAVNPEFVQAHKELIDQWIQGDAAAASSLKALALSASTNGQTYVNSLASLAEAEGIAALDTAEEVSAAINSLDFDVTGHADMTQIISEMLRMGDQSEITAGQMQMLANWVAAIGASNLEFENDTGEIHTIDVSGLNSANPMEQIAAYARVTAEISQLKVSGGWHIRGQVPAGAVPKMSPAGSGASDTGSGGGGGGGGGGSKAQKVAKAKGATSAVDPYNEVNAALEELADAYTEVDTAKDRMYGDRYRRASEEEIKNLQKQNEQLEKRVEISEKIKEAMLTGQDNPDYGIYLEGESLAKYGLTDSDNNGRVDNYIDVYNQARAAQEAAKKAMDDYWDSLGGEMDEAQKEHYKELEEAQKETADYANKITDVTNKYQDTCDKIRDDTQQIQDNMYEIEDKIIDIWNYAKDAAKELGEFREDQIDLAETLATLWGDDAVKSLGFAFDRFTNMFEANEKSLADAIIDYQNRLSKATDENMKQWYQDQIDLAQKAMANGTSVLDLNMQRMNEIYKAIDEWKESGVSELFGSNEKAMWEAFDEAWEDAVDYAKKLKGYIEDIHDNIGQVMDDMYDAMDRRNDLFDQVESQYEYLKDMTELVHGEKAYDMLEKITRKQAQAGEERLKTLEEERKANHDMLEGLEEGSEEYLKALEKEQELDDDIRDIRRDITDTYKEAKELANELAVQNWLDNFTADINGVEVPLEYAADQWERIKENADNYLDDLNRAWELEKLENEYLKLIDDAVDPNIQKQITKQMEEQLGYLREKDKLSEYDVKYANAQLEILQKTIALEDARANKNQMKLRRDSQGNYSYVYAANRNDVRDKENDLLDARMNGYNMSVEASTDATDRYLQKVQSMADQLRDVANDQNLSKEQIAAITQDIIDQGYDFLDAMGEQLTTAQRNGIESYIQAAQALSELNAGNVLDISQQLQNGMIDDLGVVTDVFHTAVKDWVDGESGLAFFRDEIDQTGRDIVRNIDDFVIAVGDANTNIEEPLSGIETQFIDANDALTRLTSSAEGFYNFLEEKSGIVGQAAADLAEYQAALTDMNSKMNEYYDAWEQRGKELESEKAINSQLRIDMSNLQEEYETKLAEAQRRASGGSGGSGSSSSTDKSNGSVVGYSGRYYSDSWGSGPSGNWFADQPGAVRISSFSRRSGYGDYNVHLETLNGGHLGWVKESQLFDTGGYTGAWGPGGKAAILHEKELVLNAQDTQNMLAAVSVVRGLVEMLKGSTFNLNNISQRGFASNGIGNNVEQRVEITAEFPNVRSAADIEAALLNLSNNAYQYAYNKNEKFM